MCALVYDNDPVELEHGRVLIERLLARIDPRLRIVALCNNNESLDPYDNAEQTREDYYVLNLRALNFEAQLRQQAQQDSLPARFSLIRMNHIFERHMGNELHYRKSEMTLAFKRIACPLSNGTTPTGNTITWRRVIYHIGVLLLILYAALHLWRLCATV